MGRGFPFSPVLQGASSYSVCKTGLISLRLYLPGTCIYFSIFLQKKQFLWLLVYFPIHSVLLEKGSALERNTLFLRKQIIFLYSIPDWHFSCSCLSGKFMSLPLIHVNVFIISDFRFLIEEMMAKHALLDGFSDSLLRPDAITVSPSSENPESSMCRCWQNTDFASVFVLSFYLFFSKHFND